MKTTVKLIAFALAFGLAAACSRNENSAQGDMDTEADSVETVSPAEERAPDGSTPSNAGSPADSAASSVDSVSNQ